MEEKKRSGIKLFLGGLLTGTLIVGIISAVYIHQKTWTPVSSEPEKAAERSEDSVLTDEVISKLQYLEKGIESNYLGEIDDSELVENLYHGLVNGLGDPYSTYYSKEEFEAVMESSEGIYYGIGAYIGFDEESGYCKITKVMEGSPAQEVGLRAEDLLVEVDGEDMMDISTSEIVTYIKGPEHSMVDITVYRDGETDFLDFTVERRQIETPTVVYEMDEDQIATIQITEFDDVTIEQFEDCMQRAKEDGMKALVLDLRDNPGGSLQAVLEVCNHILPKGLVVYTEDKDGKRKEYNCNGRDELDVPMVVLVNGNSASASEILAGAIKDYKKGTLLGTTTFGKGIVQKIYALPDDSALKLTISHYYTPSGADIHGIGIVPDEELELDVDAYLEDGTDNQMDRAKEILRSQIGE